MSGSSRHRREHSATYSTWAQMRSRCNSPTANGYGHWGGRGIKVCERWNSFEAFLADMGERPDGMSIDRIDTNGNYEPGNCRWATRAEQARNTTKTHLVERDGISKPLCDWIADLGLNSNTVRVRLHRGWSLEKALTK